MKLLSKVGRRVCATVIIFSIFSLVIPSWAESRAVSNQSTVTCEEIQVKIDTLKVGAGQVVVQMISQIMLANFTGAAQADLVVLQAQFAEILRGILDLVNQADSQGCR